MNLTHAMILALSWSALACDGDLATSLNSDMPVGEDVSAPGRDIGAPDTGPDATPPISDCGVTRAFERLSPTCATCHRTGNSPYFASVTSFHNLIVSNPTWTTPGDPGASGLIALLEGRAQGAYAQMPLGKESFADLDDRGATSITLDELRAFITDLDGCQRPEGPPRDPPEMERKSARQIVNTLYQHLGLTSSDVLGFGSNISGARFAAYSPDDVRPVVSGPNIRHASVDPTLRWFALGGGSRLYGARPNRIFSPTFGQALTQLSQAWCGFAIDKPDNLAIFPHVDRGALDAATDAQVRENLSALMLRFWGHDASAQEIDALKAGVYDPYARDESARTAWVAVCAALIRDPMWLSY